MIKENEENREVKNNEIESSWDEGKKIGDLGRFPKKYRTMNRRIED